MASLSGATPSYLALQGHLPAFEHLALRLGMTLHDLRERLSAEELFLWKAYDRESPISDRRGDVLAAIVAAAAFQAQGAKVVVADLMPEWNAPTEVAGDPGSELGESAFKRFLISASDAS